MDEAVAEAAQAIALAKRLGKRPHALGEGQDRSAAPEELLARGPATVDGADQSGRRAEHRQSHQPVVRHAVDEPRRLGVEEACRDDHGAVPGEHARAVVRDQQERAGGERLDPVALDPKVPAVEERGHGEQAGGHVEAESEALGRSPFEQAGARQLRAHARPPTSRWFGLHLGGSAWGWNKMRGRGHHSIRIGCRA